MLNKVHKKIQKNTPVKRVTIRALYACKGGYILYKENIHKGHQEDLDYVDCHRPEFLQSIRRMRVNCIINMGFFTEDDGPVFLLYITLFGCYCLSLRMRGLAKVAQFLK